MLRVPVGAGVSGGGVTFSDLLAALRARYAPPEWYLVSEVANATGYLGKGRSTYVDALALSAYPSGETGAELHGFELKVSRGDWRAELKDPGKADQVRRFCDRWWLVVPAPADAILEDGELPPGWGLMVVGKGKAVAKVKAPRLHTPHERPPLPRGFVASMVRRASEERAEKEAQKAALLKAPIRQIAGGRPGGDGFVLTCGHLIRTPYGYGQPKSVRCLACAEGLPPTIEVVRSALRHMTADELRALAADAEQRAQQVEREPAWYRSQGPGLAPRPCATVSSCAKSPTA